MDMCKRIDRRSWLLLFVAVIIVGGMAVSGTLAVIADHTVPLVNTFCPDPIVCSAGEVEVHVILTMRNLGEDEMLPEGFEFTLANVETGETYTAITDENGEAVFHLPFDADDVGTHHFRLTEVRGTTPGVVYSDLEYEIRVEVTLEDALKIVAYLDGEETTVLKALFENLYHIPIPPDTGDATPVIGYCVALLVSMTGLILLSRKSGRHGA